MFQSASMDDFPSLQQNMPPHHVPRVNTQTFNIYSGVGKGRFWIEHFKGSERFN